MNAAQIQNLLIVSMIAGFAVMEIVSRRYRSTVHATANDTKLELFMFLSLLAVTQPIAILTTSKLGAWLVPQYKGALVDWPWWAMVGHGGYPHFGGRHDAVLVAPSVTFPLALAAAPRAPLG